MKHYKFLNKVEIALGIVFFYFLIIYPKETNAMSELKELDFDVVIQENGDVNVNVVETWDIVFSDISTLYKSFDKDISKYSGITDVTVDEVTNGVTNRLAKINQYMYNVTEGCYYALNQGSQYEIAWGIENKSEKVRKEYKVAYTIKNVITKYSDCAEFYWQFLGENFEIPAKKINGKITLPYGITSKKDIKAWGHIESLNGNIKIKNENTVTFQVNRYKGNQYLEVRLALPTDCFLNVSKNNVGNQLESILREEETWASQSNENRVMRIIVTFMVLLVVGIIILVECFLLKKYIKMIKYNKKNKEIEPEINYQYFRELPNVKSSPGQAAFLLNSEEGPVFGNFTNIFSATILSLAYKKYLEIKEKEVKNNQRINYIEFSKKANDYRNKKKIGIDEELLDLEDDEKAILDFLLKVSNKQEKLPIQNINAYIKENEKNGEEFLELIEKVQTKIEVAQNINGNINHETKKENQEYQKEKIFNVSLIVIIAYITLQIQSFYYILLILIPILNLIILQIAKKYIPYLSPKGVEEQNKWRALRRYMQDYSLLKEKDMFSLTIWEYFLIYAVSFGISDKVLKQLKVEYPEINDLSIDFIDDREFKKDLNEIIDFIKSNTGNVSFDFSSGKGEGGGFSAGGGHGAGGGRRRIKVIIIQHTRNYNK